MADDAGAVLGYGEIVTALGQDWHLGEITLAVKARYCALLRNAARTALAEDAKAGLDPDAYKQGLSILNADCAAGKYAWGNRMGEAVRRSLDDFAGMERLAQLLLEPHHPGVTLDRVQELLDAEPQAFGAALSYLLGFRKKPAATGTAATTTTPAAG
jgi:hypothetical protein